MSEEPGRDHDELRACLRTWLKSHVPSGWRDTLRRADRHRYVEFQHAWRSELKSGGWLAPHWPTEWGGGGYQPSEQVVIYEEMAKAGAPRLGLFFVSLYHVAATLLTAGSDGQRRKHLPAILDGEVWCQGFSEPDAGSDLANLKTRAVGCGDHYEVSGQKLWSSLADRADWCLLLARTDPAAHKRAGISYFMLDLRSPGVDIRPFRHANGGLEFFEVFLDSVPVPLECRIGAENDGWNIARTTLAAERGVTILELTERMREQQLNLVELASGGAVGQKAAVEHGHVRHLLAALEGEVEIAALLASRLQRSLAVGEDTGVQASVVKVFYSELLQRLTDAGVQLEGLNSHQASAPVLGLPWDSGVWMLDHINSWGWTISGGTNEIQRNVIGERGLGLPREPGI